MNNTTKIEILSYASQPDKSYKYEGDYEVFIGKTYKGEVDFVAMKNEKNVLYKWLIL